MSERLEKEIEQYTKESLAIKFPVLDKELIASDIKHTAQYFYNLALEDVKNEVEKEKMNNVKDFSNGCDEDQCYGFDLALKHIEVFIDQLNK